MVVLVCTFFGHRECYGLDKERLEQTIEALIGQGVKTFYVGNQGQFDAAVAAVLRKLQQKYPEIHYAVVLAYLPIKRQETSSFDHEIFPEGIEVGPPKFAIQRRNRWMLARAEYVVCFVQREFGGAHQFLQAAKRLGKRVINLG